MSDLLENLFSLAMDQFPYIPAPELKKAEEMLEERLGKEGEPLLQAFADAFLNRSWEEKRYIFYLALSLGIELATFTPSAGACRRR